MQRAVAGRSDRRRAAHPPFGTPGRAPAYFPGVGTVSKANKAGTATATRKGPQAAPASHRFNFRGAIILMVAVPAAVAGFFVLKHFSAQKSQSSYLGRGPQGPRRRAARPGLHLRHQLPPEQPGQPRGPGDPGADPRRPGPRLPGPRGGHPRPHPDPLPRPQADGGAEAAGRAQPQGRRQFARAAQGAAEEYLKRGADDAEAHRLMARALEGVGRLGDVSALDGSPDPKTETRRAPPTTPSPSTRRPRASSRATSAAASGSPSSTWPGGGSRRGPSR